eukprot:CAMPEP_0174718862 /NCGR_PEP_ID=MMETSP1094-20130205/30195_1 /TAXON_ID=156173 /ORGANISM="Chrysochromulina brevifilum, Strain UTEX LB 985" /LENGTH=381 /DNA_ID=CAMNT_0015919065 /DNA_START=33 /DNA_END=1174 /DNA_ORIENTATION=-
MDEPKAKKMPKYSRWNIPAYALEILEEMYREGKFPTLERRKVVATHLNVNPRQVQVWFQNKRQRAAQAAANSGGKKRSAVDDAGEVELTKTQSEVFSAQDEQDAQGVMDSLHGTTPAPSSRKSARRPSAVDSSNTMPLTGFGWPASLRADTGGRAAQAGNGSVSSGGGGGGGNGFPSWPTEWDGGPCVGDMAANLQMDPTALLEAAATADMSSFFAPALAPAVHRVQAGTAEARASTGHAIAVKQDVLQQPEQAYPVGRGANQIAPAAMPFLGLEHLSNIDPQLLALATGSTQRPPSCAMSDAASLWYYERLASLPKAIQEMLLLSHTLASQLSSARTPPSDPLEVACRGVIGDALSGSGGLGIGLGNSLGNGLGNSLSNG